MVNEFAVLMIFSSFSSCGLPKLVHHPLKHAVEIVHDEGLFA